MPPFRFIFALFRRFAYAASYYAIRLRYFFPSSFHIIAAAADDIFHRFAAASVFL